MNDQLKVYIFVALLCFLVSLIVCKVVYDSKIDPRYYSIILTEDVDDFLGNSKRGLE